MRTQKLFVKQANGYPLVPPPRYLSLSHTSYTRTRRIRTGETEMSRKAFLIWGLVIISLSVISYATMTYFSLSKTIGGAAGGKIGESILLATIACFGLILHLRFKTIGRRKRILAICLPFFIASWITGAFLAFGFMSADVFGAYDRYFSVIKDWPKNDDFAGPVSWTMGQRLDFTLLWCVPGFCLSNWGLFALLWFGSLDPRTPSKTGFIRFMKHGFQRKAESRVNTPTTLGPTLSTAH